MQIPALDAFLARCGQATSVTIDVKPGDASNVINIKSQGKTPVAILGADGFDPVTQVDRAAVTFGRTGTESSLASCNGNGEDVNGDGRRDLVCHFSTQKTGLRIGDTEAVLNGKTRTGTAFEARAPVRVIS